MEKIRKVSIAFKYFFCLVFLLVLAYFITSWLIAPQSFRVGTPEFNIVLEAIPAGINIMSPLTFSTQLLAMLVAAVPLIINLWLTGLLICLFAAFSRGDIFSLKNVKRIRLIGWVMVLFQIVDAIDQAVLSLVLTWHNPVGHRMLIASLDGVNISLVVVGLLIVVISWVFAEGYKLQEEQRYTV